MTPNEEQSRKVPIKGPYPDLGNAQDDLGK